MQQKSVDRLHRDIKTLDAAKAHRHHDVHALHVDQSKLHADQKALGRDKDRFEKGKKDLARERAVLGNVKTGEKNKLAPLESERTALQAQVDASVDPLTGQPDPALQMRLDAVVQREDAVHAQYDPRVATEQAHVDALAQSHQRQRLALQTDRSAVPHDRRAVKSEEHAVAADTARVSRDRARGRHDLLPAEYKLGLHATNTARKELGLKAVHHVIRPGEPNVVGGQVGKWIAEAQTVLRQHGIPLSKMNARDIAIIIAHESAGNPRAVNNWDSNAAAGHPSEGLMQTIGPTFNEYKLAGHGHILNPVDNIIAGVRYAISRYGSISDVPGVRAVHAGGAYVGY